MANAMTLTQDTDRYNITTFDSTGAPDLAIHNVSTKIAQSWIKELEQDGVEFYLALLDSKDSA